MSGCGRWAARLVGCVFALGACAGLTGCQFFFQCAKASCTSSTTGTTTTTNTGDYAYVTNSASGPNYVAGYSIGSSTLTAVTGSPFYLGYVPVAMQVSPNNSFLYVGSGAGGIYLYTISSAGVLALVIGSGTGGAQISTATGSMSSLAISPDGNWLFAMDATGILLSEYQLNTSTGALTGPTSFAVPGTTSGCGLIGTPVSQSCTVAVSPAENYVAVALGAGGTVIFPYSSSSGITIANYTGAIPCCSAVIAPSGDFSAAFDSNSYLYIARTVTLSAYGSVGTNSPVDLGNIGYSSGVTPRSVTLSKAYSYAYTANEGAGTISGFQVSGAAVLTALSGSPYAGPASVSALGVDNSGSYLVAVGYNGSSGVQLFKPSSGVLGSAVASAATGTNPNYPTVLALTH